MTASPTTPPEPPGIPIPVVAPLLVFGAHPDDVEFGCGGVLVNEVNHGRAVHLVVCSYGESATHGTAEERELDTSRAADIMGATVEFADLGGDAHIQFTVDNAVKLAAIVRRVRPAVVLAPTLVRNQHPDHATLGELVRDACRLARYGGVVELKGLLPHAVGQLFFYAITSQAEPSDVMPVLIDVSAPDVMATWTRAMQAHGSQVAARDYVELQLTRARLRGLSAGTGHAIALFPADPLLFDRLATVSRSARAF